MELVVISGKGGTGKTTVAASFIELSNKKNINIDCDVDASNLHLMFDGEDYLKSKFYGAKVAEIITDKCINCNKCIEHCRFDSIIYENNQTKINPLRCEGCGVCKLVCTQGAITLDYEVTGTVIITSTKNGYISRAEMIPGAEGSGKLVTKVREHPKDLSNDNNYIIDGSPGIGCSVMASITNTDYCTIVTEPTQSGFEDFKRIYKLTQFFNLESFIIINKFDINLDMSNKIENFCLTNNINFLGKIPFDTAVEYSINQGIPIVNYKNSIAGKSIIEIWEKLKQRIGA